MKSIFKKYVFVICLTFVLAITLGACGGGSDKPSKDALVDNFVRLATQDQELSALPEEQFRNFFKCTLDEAYDDLSKETLDALANAETGAELDAANSGISKEDEELLAKASDACQSEISLEDIEVPENPSEMPVPNPSM